MKLSLFITLALTAATPAFAHTDGHFHTHGIENALILAFVAAAAAVVVFRR